MIVAADRRGRVVRDVQGAAPRPAPMMKIQRERADRAAGSIIIIMQKATMIPGPWGCANTENKQTSTEIIK